MAAHVDGDRRDQRVHEAAVIQAAKRLFGLAECEKAKKFLEKTRARGRGKFMGVAADGLDRIGMNGEAEPRRKADCAEHPHRVLAKAHIRVADAAQRPLAQIAQPADVVYDPIFVGIVEKRVHGEVAAQRVFLRGPELVVVHLVERPVRLRRFGGWRRVGLRIAAEGRGFNLLVAEADQNKTKAAADHKRVSEKALDLARAGVRRNIKVLGRPSEQDVADAAADEIRREPRVMETMDHRQGVRIDVPRRYLGARRLPETVEKRHCLSCPVRQRGAARSRPQKRATRAIPSSMVSSEQA